MTRTALSMVALVVVVLASPAALAADDDGWRTDVIFLEAMPAERAAALYERVLGTPPGVRVVVGKAPRSLVVRDTPLRLSRFRTLLEALDTPGRGDLRVYVRPVLHRDPSALTALARDVFDGTGGAPLILVPDDHSGRLVVRTTAEVYGKLHALLRRLDVPEETPRRRSHR